TVLALTADGSLYAVFENGEFITPALVMKNVRSFTTLHGSVFAITNKNVLYAWGYNGAGQLGDGTTSSRNTPAKILENVASVTPALEYFNGGMIRNTYAITTNGKLWAWGNNRLGQIGDGTTTNHLSPVFVMDNVAYIRPSIGSFGGFAALAILKNGELWSWRENPNNITNTRLSPAFLAHNARMPHGFDFIRWLDTQIF
ncbi:MAG: hypothetical protein FWG68_02385, partial [Defluviitaleaceae bacterium]|nr:hypothetical protein [Defluviitaleaceae bacterium]